jgi:hypothetical protein
VQEALQQLVGIYKVQGVEQVLVEVVVADTMVEVTLGFGKVVVEDLAMSQDH